MHSSSYLGTNGKKPHKKSIKTKADNSVITASNLPFGLFHAKVLYHS